jgi:stage V sporulation protein SpoVS
VSPTAAWDAIEATAPGAITAAWCAIAAAWGYMQLHGRHLVLKGQQWAVAAVARNMGM